jgi:Luciferase
MNDVDAVCDSGPTFAERALARLSGWPSLRHCQADWGEGTGLLASSRQIAHLHCADEAEIFLGWPVTERLAPALARSGQVWFAPDDGWVRLPLLGESHVDLLVSLVSVAIQAGAQKVPAGRPPCPRAVSVRFAPQPSSPSLYAAV